MSLLTSDPIDDALAVRALVVDAHDAARIGLAAVLQRQAWISRCDQARDQREAAVLARRHRPDVVVLDISNMGPFVALATSALREAHPGVTIVLSSRCGNAAAPARDTGAAAFLPSSASARAMIEAVRAAVLGHGGAEHVPATPAASAPALTVRERQVLELLATGATNREIAAQLHLGPDSVKKHAAALYRKLGVRNRTEAVQQALQIFG